MHFRCFFVISNRAVQNPQNLNKNMIKRTKETQSFPFVKQHLTKLSLTSENKILPPCDQTSLKTCISLTFFNSTTFLFVRLSVMLTVFPSSFFLVLKILLRTLYLVNLTIMARGTLLSSFSFHIRCVLSISWMVVSSPKSFFTMLIIS